MQPFDSRIPLESKVEGGEIEDSLRIRVAMGQNFERLLAQHHLDHLIESYRKEYPIILPPEKDLEKMDQKVARFIRIIAGRVTDGLDLYEELDSAINASPPSLPPAPAIPPSDRPSIETVAREYLAWFKAAYDISDDKNASWVPDRLEYQLSLACPSSGGNLTVLVALDHRGGYLDWYSFAVDSTQNPRTPPEDSSAIRTESITVIPSHLQFKGMPNRRWWQFEDAKTDFGKVEADKIDIAKLLVMEFALIQANDWFMIPMELPTGSLSHVNSLVVADTFGERTQVKQAGSKGDETWQNWRVFTISSKDPKSAGVQAQSDAGLLLLPGGPIDEGPQLEEVNFTRDELADLVWAVERTIQNEVGDPVSAYEAYLERKRLEEGTQPTTPKLLPLPKYRLMSEVPDNWIPFLPVRTDTTSRQVQLQQGAMLGPPSSTGTSYERILPKGKILRSQKAYQLQEEEVPRAGAVVTRKYRCARGTDGSTHLWIGRRKGIGRGEGSSGLKFDYLMETE